MLFFITPTFFVSVIKKYTSIQSVLLLHKNMTCKTVGNVLRVLKLFRFEFETVIYGLLEFQILATSSHIKMHTLIETMAPTALADQVAITVPISNSHLPDTELTSI